MDGFKVFLETTSIHGLGYISTTRKWSRLFWILVVIAGFTGAVILIYESFHSWTKNPVITTIETLPIADLTLPRITVCPPKNTFTDLNYDLYMTEKKNFSKEYFDETYAKGSIKNGVEICHTAL